MYEPGEIIYLTYYERKPVHPDLVMKEASKMLSAYLQNYALVRHFGGEQPDPFASLDTFRFKAREMMEKHGHAISVPFQIGLDESREYIRKLALRSVQNRSW